MRRLLRWTFRACLGAAVIVAAAGVISLRYVAIVRYDFAGPTERHAAEVTLVYGEVRAVLVSYPAGVPMGAGPGWDARFFNKRLSYLGPFRLRVWPGRKPAGAFAGVRSSGLRVPLWMIAAPFALAAAPLWRCSRRVREGHCRCGYDLAGVAVCPECGRVVGEARSARAQRIRSPHSHARAVIMAPEVTVPSRKEKRAPRRGTPVVWLLIQRAVTWPDAARRCDRASRRPSD